ncbi:Wzz/FepE/Etk N-terminal domain-containing protein [Shewanella glacialimarina]|uniref:Wzz/FepE/Etk N-terminal domain-containing protein n=1 Tax=Shewanella glacialimarina TaxID=2590884 RepID=UPI001CF84B29|nr:Wzz/FepE/Etk N-terminal domain-containing protein [Shewanella glacialimarina]UCX03989.1 LPS O-antigen length regulator [Shewanella glacialimarina]
MSSEIERLNSNTEVVSFSAMFAMLWRTKWFIIIFTMAVSTATVLYAISLPNVYRASALYLPKSGDEAGGGLAKLAGQFGGLASMAGINIGGGGTDKTVAALEFMKSRAFLQSFIEKRDLYVPILAAQGWDQASNKLIIVPELYDETNNTWVRAAPPGFKVIPTAWEAYDALNKMITVSEQSKKGFVKIELEYYSPELAAKWLAWLVEDLNAYWKAREHAQTQKSIAFLTKQADGAQLSELKNVFYQLIAEQTKTTVLNEVSDEVLFETIAPIVLPEQKSAPSRALLCIVGFALAFMLSCVLGLFYCVFRPVKNSQ